MTAVYFIKEGFVEETKGTVDKMESTFDDIALLDHLVQLRGELSQLQDIVIKQKEDWNDSLQMLLVLDLQGLASVDEQFHLLSVLKESLPDQNSTTIPSDVNYLAAHGRLVNEIREYSKTGGGWTEQGVAVAEHTIGIEVQQLNTSLRNYAALMNGEGQRQHDLVEHKLQVANKCLWTIFIVSSGLSLIGKFAGVETESSAG